MISAIEAQALTKKAKEDAKLRELQQAQELLEGIYKNVDVEARKGKDTLQYQVENYRISNDVLQEQVLQPLQSQGFGTRMEIISKMNIFYINW